MKCDRCGKPSVYHSTLIVNGVSQTTNLCRDCAIKEGVFNDSPTSLFDDMFSAFADFLPFSKVENIVCPVCKTSLREFKNTEHLGCPNCYDAFREEIENIVKRIAPRQTHKQEKLNEYIAKKSNEKDMTTEDKIANLRQEMAQAVKEERYEDAAKLKKEIQKLENKND